MDFLEYHQIQLVNFEPMSKVEVFINFSVDSINRFIGTEDADFHINELFGTPKISEIIKNYSKR